MFYISCEKQQNDYSLINQLEKRTEIKTLGLN